MTAPVVVVHLLGSLEIGGAERMMLSLCESMDSRQFEHHVVALSGRRGSLATAFEETGVKEHLCSTRPALTFPLRLARRLRELRPGILVSHVSLASGFMLAVGWLVGVPRRVAVFHSDGDGRDLTRARRLYHLAARTLLKACATDAVGVTASALALGGLANVRRVRSHVIPNAVDLAKFVPRDRALARQQLGLQEADLVILHAGRAAPEKNRQMLLPVLHRLPEGTTMVLAGAATTADLGPDSEVRAANFADLGPVEDIRTAMNAADVLLLPSVREGLPLVVLEAIASGLPVVATRLAGLELVQPHMPDLHLVEPGPDAAGSYAMAVMGALTGNRRPHEIHDTLIGTPFDLTVATERWTELCAPV